MSSSPHTVTRDKNQTLSVFFTNIRSIIPKRTALHSVLEDNSSDIVILTETWLKPDIEDKELFPAHLCYNIFRHDRPSRRGGGVLIAIKKNISSFNICLANHGLEFLCICISTSSSKVILGVCYRPPDCASSFHTELCSVLLNIKNRFPKADMLLFGDFNFPSIDWPNLSPGSSTASKLFLDMCLNLNFTQLVDKPTRSDNILDLVLTTSSDLVKSIHYCDGLSDHKVLHIDLSLPVLMKHPISKIIHDYNKADYASINHELTIFFNHFISKFYCRSVEENWVLFKSKINNLVHMFVPTIHIRSDTTNPWFTKTLLSLGNRKKRLFTKAKRTNTPQAWDAYNSALKAYTSSLRLSKKKILFSRLT